MTGPAPWIDVTAYGAKADLITAANCTTSGSTHNTLTCGAVFSPTDIGKSISVYGAGTSGADLYTTIQAVVSSTVVTLAAGAASNSTWPITRWGTDNSVPIQNAINAVKTTGGTIYFPYGGSGNYYIFGNPNATMGAPTGLAINPATPFSRPQGIRLIGECGEPGDPGNTANPSNCATIVSDQAIVMLAVGDPNGGVVYSGFFLQDIGFRDVSLQYNHVLGALVLFNADRFNLTNLRIQKVEAAAPNGYGLLFDGASNPDQEIKPITQFGVVVNPSIENTRFPVQTNNKTSEINLYGGDLGCLDANSQTASIISGSIGMDLGKTHPVPNTVTNGEWAVFGTHVLSCETAVSLYNTGVFQWYGVAESTVGNKVSGTTGLVVDGDSNTLSGNNYIGGSFNNFGTGIVVRGHSNDNVIAASITNNGVGIDLSQGNPSNTKILGTLSNLMGTSNNTSLKTSSSSLPSTLILSNSDTTDSVGGGTIIGSQLPTDLTFPQQSSAPASPASGSRTVYVDPASTDLTLKRSDGTAIDLEGGVLNYQKASATITGNGSYQGVYSFTIPFIPPGKGVRARVYFTCSTCTGAAKQFAWQFGGTGGTQAPYGTYTLMDVNLSYTDIRIFNNPSLQSPQTMFLDGITVGTALAVAGTTAGASQNTASPQSLTFLFKAANTETITPQGFIVEALQ